MRFDCNPGGDVFRPTESCIHLDFAGKDEPLARSERASIGVIAAELLGVDARSNGAQRLAIITSEALRMVALPPGTAVGTLLS
eukprot:6211194-Pleurochrysis_carterae.AAC.2